MVYQSAWLYAPGIAHRVNCSHACELRQEMKVLKGSMTGGGMLTSSVELAMEVLSSVMVPGMELLS